MTKIIAEVGNAHDGSLGNAHAYLEAVARAGADGVKLQCRLPRRESTEAEQVRPGTWFPQDSSRYAYWERMGFTRSQWCDLSAHAYQLSIPFGASVFSSHGVAWLRGLVQFWKVPAPAWSNPFIRTALVDTEGPIYWSLGHWPAVPDCPPELRERITRLYCVSRYPTSPEQLDLSLVSDRVGLSDHSGQLWPAVIAAYHRAPVVEVHVCWSRAQFGPDTPASLTIDQLAELVDAVRWVERLGRKPHSVADMTADYEQAMKGRKIA